ncbi:MFS transporter [Microbacterium nanhaiense]|uniref:MFS transporter n=1 Tax=Microbacterium nanhaiense TaxID=1301026 RepID=A0ABQ2N6N4_9MICO|nr:MFS transporter [Microbacterium nanhaiense]GGO67497.1 MFS transporter [Microbacterium nanhaiense]
MASSTEQIARTTPRDLPAAFWWLWSAQLVVWVGRFVVPYMTIFLTAHVGMSATQAGLVVGAYGIGVVISTLVGGTLADMIGRKRVLVGSELLSVVALVVIPLINDQLFIAVALAVYGLFNGTGGPVISTMVGDCVEPRHRRTAFNYNYWAVNLGFAVGPLAAGFMAEYSFSILFWAQAAVVLVSCVLVIFFVPETHAVTARAERAVAATAKPPGRAGLLGVFADRVFIPFIVIMFLYSIVYVQSTSTLPLVITAQGLPSSSFGILLAFNGALLCILQLPTARLFNRFSRNAVIIVAIAVTGIGFGMHAFAAALPMYLLAVGIWTLGEMGSHPQAQSLVADLADPERRGRYQGVYGLTHSLALAVGPILGGFVLDHAGSQVLWLSAAGLTVIVCILLGLTAPARSRHLSTMLQRDAERRSQNRNSDEDPSLSPVS